MNASTAQHSTAQHSTAQHSTAQISFVVPVYNVKPYLEQCLDSIIRTNVEKEIILIDDGSTDGSREILKAYQEKYPYITLVLQSNKGVSAARNIGIKLAKGEYIQFVDSDDYLLTDDYTWLIQQAKSSNADVLRGLCIQYHNGIKMAKDFPRALPYDSIPNGTLALSNISGDYFFKKLAIFPSVWLGFFRTEILKKHQVLFEESLFALEDLIFLFDVLHIENIKVTEIIKPIYAYNVRTGSIVNNSDRSVRVRNLFLGIDILWKKHDYYQQSNHHNLSKMIFDIMILPAYNGAYFYYNLCTDEKKEKIKHLFTDDVIKFYKEHLNIEINL